MDSKSTVSVTCTAPVNIAVIKYWGKRDTKLILPTNSSLSATLSQDSMKSTTTITASQALTAHEMVLNGDTVDLTVDNSTNKRLAAVMRETLARAQDYKNAEGKVVVKKEDWSKYKLSIKSHNNFPTAAGLASSASGLACFTACLAKLYNVVEAYPGEITTIARQGSGSACRSMYGGWVEWQKGENADGKDSIANQVAAENDWPDMRVVILVVNQGAKETPSTSGMNTSVKTSPLLQFRADHVVPQRMKDITTAIKANDFDAFAKITMQDSNQFHAICADTYPPIFYLNETSHRIISMIHQFNEPAIRAAYTFDAGPNAVIYLPAKHLDDLLQLCVHYFLPQGKTAGEFIDDELKLSTEVPAEAGPVAAETIAKCGSRNDQHKVNRIIVTKVGDGPRVSEHTVGN